MVLEAAAAGGWMGIPWARIRDRIWPTQESANASRRLVFSTFSVYITVAKTASESL